MKKTSIRTLILLLPVLAVLSGLAALPAVCLAAEELTATMSVSKEGVIQVGDSVTMTLTPSGGTPPYTYDYIMFIFEDSEPHAFSSGFISDNSYTWTVGFGSTVIFISRVRDGETIASCEVDMKIRGSQYNPIKIAGQSLSPGNTVNIGDTLSYYVAAECGQPPFTYGYEVMLYREGSWTSEKSEGHNDKYFDYTVTRGARGSIHATIEDSVGRKITSEPLDFTILGDSSPPMVLNVTSYSLVKLGEDRYRASLQVGIEGGAQPVKYVCWWYTFIQGEMTDYRMFSENTDGAFFMEESFDVALAEVFATDANGWSNDEYLEMYFNTDDAEEPVLSELLNIDLLRDSLRKNLLNIDHSDLIARLYGISEPDSSPGVDMINMIIPELTRPGLVNPGLVNPGLVNPGLVNPGLVNPGLVNPGLVNPGLVNPGLVNPEATAPEETEPEIVPPEIINPGITTPLAPNLQRPGFPNP